MPHPGAWFTWHATRIEPGMRVLDLACGSGRHALAAAQRGAEVTAVDNDREKLKALDRAAREVRVSLETVHADLEVWVVPPDRFDVVLLFNYLDRARMPAFLAAVRPGGYFLAETFLKEQREQGWGPHSDEHLLEPGELMRLTDGFELILGREVIDMVGGRPAALASVLAQRPRD